MWEICAIVLYCPLFLFNFNTNSKFTADIFASFHILTIDNFLSAALHSETSALSVGIVSPSASPLLTTLCTFSTSTPLCIFHQVSLFPFPSPTFQQELPLEKAEAWNVTLHWQRAFFH